MTVRRPVLSGEQRSLLAVLRSRVEQHIDDGSPQRAYAQGVVDTMAWLIGRPQTPLLEEVTR